MKKNKSVLFIVIALLLIIVAVFLWILVNGKETRTSTKKSNETVSVLHCSARGIENAFFTSETANIVKNEIKNTFRGDKLDKMFYGYEGTYRSSDIAEKDETNLHSKYNLYMGENNVSQDSLSPSYAVTNSKLHLTLYADNYGLINPVTAVFFFIDEDIINDFNNYSIDKMKTFYEKKSFECEINE